MSAKNYKLVVSGMLGKAYIAKVSKTNPNLMLQDRAEIDESTMYQIIEQFAKSRIKEGFRDLQVRTEDGELVYEIVFPKEQMKKG
jgi:hypothetical protein